MENPTKLNLRSSIDANAEDAKLKQTNEQVMCCSPIQNLEEELDLRHLNVLFFGLHSLVSIQSSMSRKLQNQGVDYEFVGGSLVCSLNFTFVERTLVSHQFMSSFYIVILVCHCQMYWHCAVE